MLNTALTILGTLIAAAVAGVISFLAGRSLKAQEWRLALAKENITIRRRLYADFLAEVDRLLLLSVDGKKIHGVSGLRDLTTKLAEISLLAPEAVISAARAVSDSVLTAHTIEGTENPDFHRLKQKFITEARKEMSSYEKP